MTPFLHKVCQHIIETQGADLSECLVIAPSRRAGVYVDHYLKALNIDKLPEFSTIDDWLSALSRFQRVDDLSLLFDLYAIHLEIEEEPRPFDEFLPMAKLMIADFNEVDQHLVNAESLFNYISEIKAIKLWNPEGGELTGMQKKYLSQYRGLTGYYSRLKEKLLSRGHAYSGMAYRYVAENIQQILYDIQHKKIFFIGFNALSKSEMQVIKALENAAVAELYWDADQYYMDNKVQEAGFYLRYLKDVFKTPFNFLEDNFGEDKTINITGVSKNVGQTLACRQLLEDDLQDDDSAKRTVVVLANEDLLQPMLFALPDELSEINISIGESIKYGALTDVFYSLIELHETKSDLKHLNAKGNSCFYAPNILKLLRNSYLQVVFKNVDFRKIVDKIIAGNKTFLAEDEIIKFINDKDVVLLFKTVNTPLDLIGLMEQFIVPVMENVHEQEKNIAKNIENIIKQLGVLTDDMKTVLSEFKTLRRFFMELVNVATITGVGDPMSRVQIMGLLETRALDFDHVIILSANEGDLPAQKSNSSFIPFDIRRDFEMPSYQEKDAIFAYHFYRLLQRAEKIDILYNTESDKLSDNDKSRFVYQIIHELREKNPNITINETFFHSKPLIKQEKFILSVDKTPDILADLKLFFQHHYLSASVINKYISCKLKFYLSKIKGLSERDEIEETIDAKTLGTVVHEALQDIYAEVLNRRVTKEWLSSITAEKIASIIKTALDKNFENGNVDYGKNLLIAEVAASFIRQLINKEKEQLLEQHTMEILALEKEFNAALTVGDVDFKITAYIDRIDLFDGILRVIDYKTGNVDSNKELLPATLCDLMSDAAYAKAFQLFLYAWMYQQSYPENTAAVQPAIISLKKIKNYTFNTSIDGVNLWDKVSLEAYENSLKALLAEMIDPEIPFSQTEDIKQCEYCEFKAICMR